MGWGRGDIMGQVDLDCLLQAYNKLHGLLCDYDQEQRLIDQIYQSLQEAVDELPELVFDLMEIRQTG